MINADWHQAHRMPKNPTEDQRIAWHVEHSKHCDCRKASPKLKAEMERWQKQTKGKKHETI